MRQHCDADRQSRKIIRIDDQQTVYDHVCEACSCVQKCAHGNSRLATKLPSQLLHWHVLRLSQQCMQFRSQQYCNTMTVSALPQQQLHAFAEILKYDVNTGDELGLF